MTAKEKDAEDKREAEILDAMRRAVREKRQQLLRDGASVTFVRDGKLIRLSPEGEEVIKNVVPRTKAIPGRKLIVKWKSTSPD